MANCINSNGAFKVKYKSFESARQFANKRNKKSKRNSYFYYPLRTYRCEECNYIHIGRSTQKLKGNKWIILKIIDKINLNEKINIKKDIIIQIPFERFTYIKREVNVKYKWNLTIDFYLKRLPIKLSENSKIYICNGVSIKGYFLLKEISDNKLKCIPVFHSSKQFCTFFINFKYIN